MSLCEFWCLQTRVAWLGYTGSRGWFGIGNVDIHKLKQLSKKVMPNADAATRKQLLLHQFVSGLPAHIGKQLRATGEVNDLEFWSGQNC